MTGNKIIISFVGDADLRDRLKQWAAEDDRSISAVIRRAIEGETERRAAAQPQPIQDHGYTRANDPLY